MKQRSERSRSTFPDHVKLTTDDQEPSDARKGEEMWEQQVRNLKSHDTTPGNILHEGFADRPKKGTYRITQAGLSHLRHKGLV